MQYRPTWYYDHLIIKTANTFLTDFLGFLFPKFQFQNMTTSFLKPIIFRPNGSIINEISVTDETQLWETIWWNVSAPLCLLLLKLSMLHLEQGNFMKTNTFLKPVTNEMLIKKKWK